MTEGATQIKWEDPSPEPRGGVRGSGKWSAVADGLRANPSRWALVSEDASAGLSTMIKRGRISAFAPDGAFESKVRNNGTPDRYKVYARFVGTKVAS